MNDTNQTTAASFILHQDAQNNSIAPAKQKDQLPPDENGITRADTSAVKAELESMPLKNTTSYAATSADVSKKDEVSTLSLRAGRSNTKSNADKKKNISTPTESESMSRNEVTQNALSVLDSVSSKMNSDSAMIKYNVQDYSGAIGYFEKDIKQDPNDEKTLYYEALSYLNLRQTDKAIADFDKILKNKRGKYYDPAKWYESVAYLGSVK